MHRIRFTIFLSAILIAWSSWGWTAETLKIGYVDMQRALNTCEAGKEAKKIIKNLLEQEHIKEQWEDYQRSIRLAGAYFRSEEYHYQSDEIQGGDTTRTVSGDLNLYKLFLERIYYLLKPRGYCGVIIPSGFHTDAGTKGLRRLLFEENQVIELYSFENRRGIFSSIHKSFKFDLLMFSGISFGGFNIVDAQHLYQNFKKPIIIITGTKPRNNLVKKALKNHFLDWRERFSLIKQLGKIYCIKTVYNNPIYFEVIGLNYKKAKRIIQKLTFTGRYPEPIRVIKLLANDLV